MARNTWPWRGYSVCVWLAESQGQAESGSRGSLRGTSQGTWATGRELWKEGRVVTHRNVASFNIKFCCDLVFLLCPRKRKGESEVGGKRWKAHLQIPNQYSSYISNGPTFRPKLFGANVHLAICGHWQCSCTVEHIQHFTARCRRKRLIASKTTLQCCIYLICRTLSPRWLYQIISIFAVG